MQTVPLGFLTVRTFICMKEKPYTKLKLSPWGDAFPLGYEALNFLKLPCPLDGYYMLKKIREFFLADWLPSQTVPKQ